MVRSLCTSNPSDSSIFVEAERSHEVIKTKQRRLSVIQDPALNRGTGFSADERERLCLRGLVPPRQQNLEQQIQRVMKAYRRQRTDLDRFQFLSLLMDRNTVLFYRVMNDYFAELAPIVYTPTVGEACQKFHSIYRRTRGMYFSMDDRNYFRTMVFNWPRDHVDVIVVTDGSRVLSLGDLGCNSMNIPIGKLALYVSGAGINPLRVLPVVLDFGTDNDELRENPLYLGLPKKRLKGEQYFEVFEEWILAIRHRWPNALIQFEDFSTSVATPLLERYRYRCAPAFNDDIQSTGCVAVATIFASMRARRRPANRIGEEKIVCVGAGSAGIGVCEALVQAMVDAGYSQKDAYSRFYLLDHEGLLGQGRSTMDTAATIHPFIREDLENGSSLEEVVRTVKPTILLGLSGQGGLFTEDIVKAMASFNDQPVILPMSNPSNSSECTASDVFQWTEGRAIFASGSPFDNVTLDNGKVCFANQANNVYSFPGLGLAVTALRISAVTDQMFLAAAKRIAELLPDAEVEKGLLFPPLRDLRIVSAEVAAAVGMVAVDEGLVRKKVDARVTKDFSSMLAYMKDNMWTPMYGHLVGS